MAARSLVIKVIAGADDPERCVQAFNVAAAAVTSGVTVSLWLAGEGAWLALPGKADGLSLPHSPPLAELMARVLDGGEVSVCSQCAARRGIGSGDLLPGIRISGATTFVAQVTEESAQALVY